MEVLFTTMEYDTYGGEPRSSPGDILAEAIGYLYQRIVSDPTLYPQGLTIRVLVRDDTPLRDFRMRVLDDVRRHGVLELENNEIGWKLEVAHYRNSFRTVIYSHAKFMVVDGSSVLTAGYNMTSNHLDDLVDFGVRATGPIAHDALMKFDYLWQGGEARSCDLASPIWKLTCSNLAVETGHLPDAEAIRITGGDTNIFSLFRAGEPGMNEADDAVRTVLSSAQNSIEVLNPWFTLHSMNLRLDPESSDFDNLAPDYMRGLRDAIVSNDNVGNTAFQVRILLAPDGYSMERWNELGIKTFLNELGDLERYVEFKIFAGASHAKVSVVDGQFLIVGSQNWSYAAFGNVDEDWDHPEYSLGVDSLMAAGDFLDSYFDGGFGYWNLGIEPTIVRDGDDLKAAIENASDGDIIAIHGDRFEITEPIEITSEIKIIGTGSTLLPGSPLADAGSAHLASLVQQNEEPLIRILASNVEVSGLRIEGTEGIGIEIGEEEGDIENVQISYVTFDGNGKAGIRVRGETADYRIENSTFIGGQFGIMIWLEDEEQFEQSVIRNNIFVSQWHAPIDIFPTDGGETEYSYNLFFQCDAGSCEDLFINGQPGANSIVHDNLFDVDPEFVDLTGGDYSLLASSPAIDAGDPSVEWAYLPDGDGDGVGQIDMGAFEFIPTDNSPPEADSGGPYASLEGSPIAFDASGSSDPDGDPLEFRWDFDADGAFDTTYSPYPTTTFTFEDDFAGEALLEVRDSGGLTDTSVAVVQISNVAPAVDAGADIIVEVSQELQFTGSFTDPGIQDTHTLLWEFGDGDSAEGTLTPTHSFDSAGMYEVTLTVTDDDAGSESDTLTVTVVEAESDLRPFVLLGKEGVYLKQNATVVSGDVGADVASDGPYLASGSEVTIGIGATMQDPASRVLGDSLKLKDNAQVYDVYYNELSGLGDVLGQHFTPLDLPLVSAFPDVPVFSAGTLDFDVPRGGTQTIDAGSYGLLKARKNSVITFTGGTYDFSEWDVGLTVDLFFEAPSEVRIVGRLAVDQNSTLGPAPGVTGMDARDIVIYVNGINGGTGNIGATPKAAKFGLSTEVQANVYVPNGTLWLRQNGQFTGGFVGKWVVLGRGATAALLSDW